MLWRSLGSWSGRNNVQTESFVSETGYLRIRWETTNETAPGAGRFQLAICSSISGRTLMTAADAHGVGHDTVYLNEDARPFYAVIQSSDLDWKFTVDEGVSSTVEEGQKR